MSEEARRIWQEKLNFLRAEEAKCSDPAQRFKIQQDIAEARDKLEELKPSAGSPQQAAPDAASQNSLARTIESPTHDGSGVSRGAHHPEPERGAGPVVILTARQLLGVFVLCAILGAATFLVNRVVGSVFLSLAVAVALFGFLGGVAHVENRWGKFGGLCRRLRSDLAHSFGVWLPADRDC